MKAFFFVRNEFGYTQTLEHMLGPVARAWQLSVST